jgi:hypothetical protein
MDKDLTRQLIEWLSFHYHNLIAGVIRESENPLKSFQ